VARPPSNAEAHRTCTAAPSKVGTTLTVQGLGEQEPAEVGTITVTSRRHRAVDTGLRVGRRVSSIYVNG
jgi:hypothetical protein